MVDEKILETMTRADNYFCKNFNRMTKWIKENKDNLGLTGGDHNNDAMEFAKADGHPEHVNDEHYEFWRALTYSYTKPNSGKFVNQLFEELKAEFPND